MTFLEGLVEWVNRWREVNPIPETDENGNRYILKGDELEKFVSDLQNEICLRIDDKNFPYPKLNFQGSAHLYGVGSFNTINSFVKGIFVFHMIKNCILRAKLQW